MKRTNLVLLILLATISGTARSDDVRTDALWRLVAQSHVIATGTLEVPVDYIRSCLASNRHDYAEIGVTIDKALKGNPPKTFVVRWYTEPRDYAPTPERIIAANGKKALMFLVHVKDDAASAFYFAGYTPRALADGGTAQVNQVQNEVAAQRDALTKVPESFPPSKLPLYEKVKSLINATTRKDSQMESFSQLEELGAEAVPAIIMLMDDRRDLAFPQISLWNKSPEAFEGIRHYGPEKVVDAMDAILNQITGEAFGQIYNGGTERERQEAITGWRIYLSHLIIEMHNKASEDSARSLADPQR